jgi:hypothetical protein
MQTAVKFTAVLFIGRERFILPQLATRLSDIPAHISG